MSLPCGTPVGMPDAILDKVRKLLAKAEDPACTPAEAESFTAKAAELIAKYGVDTALLAAADPALDPVGDLVIEVPAPYALDKCSLISGIAGVLRCRAIRRDARHATGRRFSVHLFGHGSDLRRTEILFTSLLVQASQALAAHQVPGWQHPAAYRRSWLAGYTYAVVTRLGAAERRAADDAERDRTGPSVALVLADRSAQVARRVSEAYPRLGLASPRRLSGNGRSHGYAAGQRADLGGTQVTTTSDVPAVTW